MADDNISIFTKIAQAIGLGSLLAFFAVKTTSRRKEKIDFYKAQFEGAQQMVTFWKESGEKLKQIVLEYETKYNDLEAKYNDLDKKYSLVLAELKRISPDSELLKMVM